MKSVKIKCYNCKKIHKINMEENDESEGKSFWSKKVPINLANQLLNKYFKCRECETQNYIGSTHPEFITLNSYPERKQNEN